MNVKLTQMIGETIDAGAAGGYVRTQERGYDKNPVKVKLLQSPRQTWTLPV